MTDRQVIASGGDDTAQWQAALDALARTGGCLVCPSPVYRLSAGVTLDQAGGPPVWIQGGGASVDLQIAGRAGTTLQWEGPAGGTMLTLVGINGGGLDGLQLDCGLVHPAAVGLAIRASVGARYRGITVRHAAQWAFTLTADGAGVYQNTFDALTSDRSCHGGMRHAGGAALADVALNLFTRLDLNYCGAHGGLDLAASDNNVFLGLVLRCADGATGGPFLILRDEADDQFGARANVFLHVDGATELGPPRTLQADSRYPNVIYGYDYTNGMPAASGAHPERLFLHDTAGGIQAGELHVRGHVYVAPGQQVHVGRSTYPGRTVRNPTNAINIYEGELPLGAAAGCGTLTTKGGKLWATDADGVSTQLTP